jgi:tetratricopeptide (TPR) repeat protein
MARVFFLRRALFFPILLCGSLLLPTRIAHTAEPSWIRVSSAHFSVLTNGGEKNGRDVIARFEQMRSVFAQLLSKTKVNMPVPLDIIAVRSDEEYARLAPLQRGHPISAPGFFLAGEDRDYIVLDLSADSSWRAISHPFAHLLLNFNYPPTQGWFDEGFAEYFSSMRMDNRQVLLGGDPESSFPWRDDLVENPVHDQNSGKSFTELLSVPVWLSISDLFTTRHEITYQEGTHHTLFYAESWMVMHYLISQNKLSETGTYFGSVEIKKRPVDQAIQQAYGLTPAQLQDAVKDYFHSLQPLLQTQDPSRQTKPSNPRAQLYQSYNALGPTDIGGSVQSVAENEAKSLLAEMELRIAERRDQAVKELDAIVADERVNNSIAHRGLAWAHMERKEFNEAAAELDTAAELNGRDPWVRFYRALSKYWQGRDGRSFPGLSNMIQDLRVVLDWNPELAEGYNMLAMARLDGGGVNSALESMREAIRLSPRNNEYLLGLAQIYMAGKKWDEATALLERLKNSPNAKVAQQASQNLQDLPMIKKYGVPPPQQNAAETPVTYASPDESRADEREGESSAAAVTPTPPRPDTRKVQFLKGRLVKVDCGNDPVAIITVAAGPKTLKLRTDNYKSLVVIGADEFSCAWSSRPIAANYKQGGKADGDLVSLEIQ